MTPEQRETLTAMLQEAETSAVNWRRHVHETSWAEGRAIECDSRAAALRAALSRPAEPRINTPCPACGSRTLFIGEGGHLTCSLIGCKQPGVERAIAELRPSQARDSSPVTARGAELAALDPGIRDVVIRLNAAGFTTTDSGDGCSKVAAIDAGEALPFRHVACVVSREALFSEADRLLAVLGAGWTVEASYHPPDGHCLLFASEDDADDRRPS
jgi:hypothetical protein